MIDKNNLKRIRGVLSAKQGAEIPKYNDGNKIALPFFNPGDTFFKEWREKSTTASSNYLTAWRDYSILKSEFPSASIDDLASYMDSGTGPGGVALASLYDKYKDTLSNTSPGTSGNAAIPGANPNLGDPNASVNNAAEVTAKTNEAVTSKTIDAVANTTAAVTKTDPQIQPVNATSLNTGLVTTPPQVNPIKATVNEMQKEGDQAAAERQEKLDKKEKAASAVGLATTAVMNGIGQAVGAKQAATDSELTQGVSTVYNTAASTLQNAGGVAGIVGTAMQFAGIAGDVIQELGGGTDQQTTIDKIMDSPLFSWNIGMLNGFAGKNADEFGLDTDTLSKVGSSYGGTAADLQEASDKAGKKYGLFSNKKRKEANEAIAQARLKQNKMAKIAGEAEDDNLLVQSMGTMAGLSNSMQLDGGYSQKYTYSAKQGGSLNMESDVFLEWEPTILLEWEPQVELNWELPVFKEGGNIDIVEELEWIPEFKAGGKTNEFDVPETEETSQKNVIPEGALHKNKHHMEHAEGLTKKGIPVIDDEGEQQAEIEHSEIIFTLEVTKKLEEYYEIFYSDESSNQDKEQAAIDAGKLLVYQILENTEDRTGLIESCKKGGSITLKTTTDDLIEEVLEGESTMVIIEEKEVEEKPKNKKEKSDKELMKEAIKEALIELLIK